MLNLSVRLETIDTLHEFFEHQTHFHSGQPRTETKVRPVPTKRHMKVVGPSQIESERVLESLFVVIRGVEPDGDFVSGFDLLATHLDISDRLSLIHI